MRQRIGLQILILFFVAAGSWHFIDAPSYYPLIPDYLPFPRLLNFVSGVFEILFGLALIWDQSRNLAGWALIVLLILFIPSHIHLIQQDGCIPDSLCVPSWVAWVRLIIVHPLLPWWIWYSKNYQGRVI